MPGSSTTWMPDRLLPSFTCGVIDTRKETEAERAVHVGSGEVVRW